MAESGQSSLVEVVVLSPTVHESVGILNPGHIALSIDEKIYNYGRYWGAFLTKPWSGAGVLIVESKKCYISSNLVKRGWIYGFAMAGVDVAAMQAELSRLWFTGTPSKEGKPGRQINDYLMTQNDCKQFVLGRLRVGGLEIPPYFEAMDYPEDTVKDMRAWHQSHPEIVTSEIRYR